MTTEVKEYEYHEVANIFPLNRETIEELKISIKKQGLHEPIEIYDGKIIDGRQRYEACREIGITPTFANIQVPDIIAYVLMKNLERRHLTDSQRAAASAKADFLWDKATKDSKERQKRVPVNNLSPPDGGNKKKRHTSAKDIAKQFNISERTVQRGSTVHKKGITDLLDHVEKGNLKIATAERIAQQPKEDQSRLLKEQLNRKKKPKLKKIKQESNGDAKKFPNAITEWDEDRRKAEEAIIKTQDFLAACPLWHLSRRNSHRLRGFKEVGRFWNTQIKEAKKLQAKATKKQKRKS